ncbi:MAG: ribosome biogenesis GTPase Der [Rhodospirillaceae bacterium]|jgi:GTP-binding protein|nr:ribosome biogenesis GTPase Der [Rhodospirillaceae bacterium]
MSLKVAIVGCPNVGKSTLFNRLTNSRLAIVHDRPGVTRDRHEGHCKLFNIIFTLIDTAGLTDIIDDSIEGRMSEQTKHAISEADVILFLIDARNGITPFDVFFANQLRKSLTPVVVVANKCENKKIAHGFYESYSFGFGEPIPFSAEHGQGIDDLYNALIPFAIKHDAFEMMKVETCKENEDNNEVNELKKIELIKMVVVGRPNVGKSTITNRLLNEDRMITGPESGLTRDSIVNEWKYKDHPILLVDTAGLRRSANISDSIEHLSVLSTIKTIHMAHVVVLVIDAKTILDKQDLTIARMVIDEGRALVIAVNKWDIIENCNEVMQHLKDRLSISLPQVRGVPIITISALFGEGLDRLMNAIMCIYKTWNKRISTGYLNRWLSDVIDRHPPPVIKSGRRIHLRYITQVRIRPPTFSIFTQRAEEIPESYNRYLINDLRKEFDFAGIPIRLALRKRHNPYVN